MFSAEQSKNYRFPGDVMSGIVARSTSGHQGIVDTVPAGNAGTLSTRTDNETGTATLGASHTITTGMIVDIYWANGGARYGVTVGTVSGTSVPIGADNAGTGDSLPAQGTAIIVAERMAFDIDVLGESIKLMAFQIAHSTANLEGNSRIEILDDVDASIEVYDLASNLIVEFDVEGRGSAVNPIGDGIMLSRVYASNRQTEDATLKFHVMYDSTILP